MVFRVHPQFFKPFLGIIAFLLIFCEGGSAELRNNIANAQNSWFENTSAGNLHLVYDLDDDSRPLGSAYDIGADELQ